MEVNRRYRVGYFVHVYDFVAQLEGSLEFKKIIKNKEQTIF